ncbi:MAG TPA: hypothetical protein PK657_03405 [Legionella sp.]|nr:hypothetical protein [Legionella sp.]
MARSSIENSRMGYSDFLEPAVSFIANFRQKHDYLIKARTNFIHFYPRKPQYNKDIDRNWKARLSVQSDDLHRAWEVIFPLLIQNNVPFKVINDKFFNSRCQVRKQQLSETLNEYQKFRQRSTYGTEFLSLELSCISTILLALSLSNFRLVSTFQQFWTRLKVLFLQSTLNQQQLVSYVDRLYKKAIKLKRKELEGSIRMNEGMQFTLYITPGREQEYQQLLEIMEQSLIDAQIKPGVIYPTDRTIGVYSSIRHPGRWWYHPAVDLETYNPDNVHDPFVFLKTLVEDQHQYPVECGDKYTPEALIALLRSPVLLSPSQLSALAVHKEAIIQYIQTAPPEKSEPLRKESLDKATTLGKFFRVQRGFFMPKSTRGTLKKLHDIEAMAPVGSFASV